MRAIIGMMLCFFLLTIPLSVIAVRESDATSAVHAVLSLTIASGLLWHLTRKYRTQKRSFRVSVGLLLLSLFNPADH